MKVWLDGALVDEGAACVSTLDHGFLAGDGVFETLRVYAGQPFALDEHLARLEAGTAAIGIPFRSNGLPGAVRELLDANEAMNARVRITVTSGRGPAGLARGDDPPTVLVTAAPLVPWRPTATAVVSRLRRDQHSLLTGVKTSSLAESVVAYAEARAAGADEALLPNLAGEVCEATTANVFVVLDGAAVTPPLESGCLAGITRGHVLELGAEERTLLPEDLRAAKEAFFTSSTRELQPLVAIDGHPVGDGAPGPVTKGLGEAYSALVSARLG